MTISLGIFNRHALKVLPTIKIVAEFEFNLCLEETHMPEEPVWHTTKPAVTQFYEQKYNCHNAIYARSYLRVCETVTCLTVYTLK